MKLVTKGDRVMDGENNSIRFVEENDLPLVQVYCSSKEIAETTSIPHPYPDGGAEYWNGFVLLKEEVLEDVKHSGYMFSFYQLKETES